MERDKLEEGKKTFHEDKEKYEKFKMDLQAKAQTTEEELRLKQKLIEDMVAQLQECKKKDEALNTSITKKEEEITAHKAHKKFLDLIAIASKHKTPIDQKERRKQK